MTPASFGVGFILYLVVWFTRASESKWMSLVPRFLFGINLYVGTHMNTQTNYEEIFNSSSYALLIVILVMRYNFLWYQGSSDIRK